MEVRLRGVVGNGVARIVELLDDVVVDRIPEEMRTHHEGSL